MAGLKKESATVVSIDRNTRTIVLRLVDGREVPCSMSHAERTLSILDDWQPGRRVVVTTFGRKLCSISDD